MARLSIRLLGPFDVSLDGESVTGFASDKVRALLVYLVMNSDQTLRREALAGLLWPEYPEGSARASLRNALAILRQAIGDRDASPPYLQITRQSIRFDGQSNYWLDAAELASTAKAPAASIAALERAASLYRGSFLAGFSTSDSAAFEEWVLLTREQFNRQIGEVLRELVQRRLARGAYPQALPHAWRYVELDPWREDAQRLLIRLLALDGQRTAALAQYEACRQVLANELDVEPEPETTRLYKQIRDGELDEPGLVPVPTQAPEAVPQLPAFLIDAGEQAPPPLFVAREQELAWLEEKLEDTLSGRGQVLFVTGGPGRGKTTLLAEFARRAMAENPDLLAATGTCNALSGVGDPYLPFREVLAMLTGDVEAAYAAGAISRDHAQRLWTALPLTCQALVDHGPHLAPALIPCLALLDRAALAPPDGAPWLQQLSNRIDCSQTAAEVLEETDLFQQVTNLLRALAREKPVLLLLDDLQWVDSASAALLFHLGRRLVGSRILIAGAYRPEESVSHPVRAADAGHIAHPLRQVRAELQRQYGDIFLDLADVSKPHGRRFVDSFLDSEPNRLGERFRSALFEHTGGHPLFTVELLRAMRQGDDLVRDSSGDWIEGPTLHWDALPPRIEGIVQARLDRLEPELRELLSVASVEGETFTAQVVARVQGLNDRQVLRVLSQELEDRHHLVHEHSVTSEGSRWLARYRFSHALFQQYVYQSLGEGERRLMHGEVAAALEELHEGQIDEIAVALAHHYTEAYDQARARKYFTLAGDAALAAYASREAEDYFRRALALGPPAPEEADLLANLGEALGRQNRFQEAMDIWRDGLARYQALEDGDAVSRLYARSAWAAIRTGDSAEGLALCLQGLGQANQALDGPGLALLLHETAEVHTDQALRTEGEPYARRALEMAERLGDVELQAQSLTTWGIFAPSSEESLAMTIRAVDLAEKHGLLLASERAHRYLAFRLKDQGDQDAAHRHLLRSAELAGQTGLTAAQISAIANLAISLVQAGDFDGAEEALSQMRLLLGDLTEPTRAATLVLMAEINYLGHRGEWAACTHQARKVRASMRERGTERELARAAIWLGWGILEPYRLGIAVHTGEWQEAEDALAEATEIYDRSLSPKTAIASRLQWSTLCILQGRLADARRLLAEANEKASALHSLGWTGGHLQWLEALVAAAEGDWVGAMDWFDAACKTLENVGARSWRARVLLDWSEAHASRGQPGDRQRAADLLREAEEAFQDMGVPRYAAIARERLQELETMDA